MEFDFVAESMGFHHDSVPRTSGGTDEISVPANDSATSNSMMQSNTGSQAPLVSDPRFAWDNQWHTTTTSGPASSFEWSDNFPTYQVDTHARREHAGVQTLHHANFPASQSLTQDQYIMSNDITQQASIRPSAITGARVSIPPQHTPPYIEATMGPQITTFPSSGVPAPSSIMPQPDFTTPPPDHTVWPSQALAAIPRLSQSRPSEVDAVITSGPILPEKTEHFPIWSLLKNYALGLTNPDDYLKKQVMSAERNLNNLVTAVLTHRPSRSQPSSPSSRQSITLIRARLHCPGVTGVGGSMVPGASSRHKASGEYVAFRPNDSTYAVIGQEKKDDATFDYDYKFIIGDSGHSSQTLDSASRAHVVKTMRRKRQWQQRNERAKNGEETDPDAKGKRKRAVRQSSESGSSESPPQVGRKKVTLSPLIVNKSGVDGFDLAPIELNDVLETLRAAQKMPYTADPFTVPAPTLMDPFSNSRLEQVTGGLLHHFAWVMPSLMDEIVSGTVFNRIGWLYSAVAAYDPSPAHTIIGYTLCHISKLRNVPEPPQAIEHRQKGQELIRRRARSHEECFSDDLVGSILNVAGWELIMCNSAEHAIHVGGIRRIVKHRGGVDSFASQPRLRRELFRIDAIRAYIAISAPRYPTWSEVRNMESLAIELPAQAGLQLPPTHEGSFCAEALQLIHELEDLLSLVNSISEMVKNQLSRNPDASKERALDNKPLIEEYLRICLRADTTEGDPIPYQKCMRLAALVFIDAALEHFFDGERPDSGRHRLESLFIGSHADRAMMVSWGRSLQMVLHVLLSADRQMLEKPWRAFYFADALLISMAIDRRSWRNIQLKLEKYLRDRIPKARPQKQGERLSEAAWDLKTNVDWLEHEWSAWDRRNKDWEVEAMAMEQWYKKETQKERRKGGTKAAGSSQSKKKAPPKKSVKKT